MRTAAVAPDGACGDPDCDPARGLQHRAGKWKPLFSAIPNPGKGIRQA